MGLHGWAQAPGCPAMTGTCTVHIEREISRASRGGCSSLSQRAVATREPSERAEAPGSPAEERRGRRRQSWTSVRGGRALLLVGSPAALKRGHGLRRTARARPHGGVASEVALASQPSTLPWPSPGSPAVLLSVLALRLGLLAAGRLGRSDWVLSQLPPCCGRAGP